MYWILFIMAGIAALVIALIVGGLVTPRDHAVARTAVIAAPAAAIWASIRDVARYADWRDELEAVEVLEPDQGRERWCERSIQRAITFVVSVDEPPHHFAARIVDDDHADTAEWRWTVLPDGDAARVTICKRGRISNPVMRFVSTHFAGHTKPLDRYLRDLATRHQHSGITIDDATPA